MDTLDFSAVTYVHFVGIKGIAMAALAIWAKEQGMRVTGSDVHEQFPSDPMLKKAGIGVFEGFSAKHLSSTALPDLVVYTGAHSGIENVEVKESIRLGVRVLPHGKALGFAMQGKRQISVAGSHGKTTTSSMIATVLTHAGLDPSYAIGCGEITGLGMPGHAGRGEFFVAEADEYVTDPTHDRTPRFLWQHPDIAVITNIDFDHPDAYASLADVQNAFVSFVRGQKGKKYTVVNAKDAASAPVRKPIDGNTVALFGEGENASFRVRNIRFSHRQTHVEMLEKNGTVHMFTLSVPGRHNAYNAAAAAVACRAAGLGWKEIQEGLAQFGGAKRRFEFLGEKQGILYYDDYAHHPKEIAATLSSARDWFSGKRIIAVFQPHTYSRTVTLLDEFSHAFHDADFVLISDIYASARETETFGITGQTLVDAIAKHNKQVLFTPLPTDVTAQLNARCKQGDVVIFIGAGDIYTWEKTVKESVSL